MLIIIEGKHPQNVPITLNGLPLIVNAGETVYSDAVVLPDHEDVALSYRAKSIGLPNVNIYMEECHVEPKDNDVDDRCVVADFGKAIVEGLIDTKQHHARIHPLSIKCFRFRVEQISKTAPETTVELIVSCK